MRKRWPIERSTDSDKAQRFIITRYFIAQSQSRALLRHGIARLWWYASITHDPERKNPYELTGVLLSQLDITQQILERNLGRARQVLIGFLEFLLRHRRELLGSGDGKRADTALGQASQSIRRYHAAGLLEPHGDHWHS